MTLLTRTTSDVIDIPDVSLAIASDSIANGINDLKAPKVSPAFTGIPTAPTAAEGTNTTQLATTAFVQRAAYAGTLPTNTRMPFTQAAAPIGWTQITTYTDHMLRVVSTAGGGTGGTHSPILMNVVPSHTHTMTGSTGTSAAHTHTYYLWGMSTGAGTSGASFAGPYTATTQSAGNHTHTISAVISNNSGADNWYPKYINTIFCNKL